jgi:hypothetical protein
LLSLFLFTLLDLYILGFLTTFHLSKSLIPSFVEKVEKSDRLSSSGFEFFTVLPQDNTEAHVFASLVGNPSSFSAGSDDHLEVLSLTGVCDVDDSISFECVDSVVDGGEVGAVVVVTSVRFDGNKRDLVFLDEDAFCFSTFGSG